MLLEDVEPQGDEPPSKKVCFACWALSNLYERRSQALTFKTSSVNSLLVQLKQKNSSSQWQGDDVEFLVHIYSENLDDDSPKRKSSTPLRGSQSNPLLFSEKKKKPKEDGRV